MKRRIFDIKLSSHEIIRLKSIIMDESTSQRVKNRANILLMLNNMKSSNVTTYSIAEVIGVTRKTVYTIKSKYYETGSIDKTIFEKNNYTSKPRKDPRLKDIVSHILNLEIPNNRDKWSSRMISDYINENYEDINVSHTSINKIINNSSKIG